AARGRQEIAKANLERTETLLGFCRILAPFAGVVTSRMVDPGAFIPAGSSGASSGNSGIFTLMDFSRVRVQTAVPEAEVPLVKTGLAAVVTVDELPRAVFNGSVTRFSHSLEESTRTMLTEIELPNPEGVLRPGMYARVRLILERKSGVLVIPSEAVQVEKTR